jgi:hypothetical protein
MASNKTTKNIYSSQIQNRNYLSPVGFRFTLTRYPKVAFFSNKANIPGLSLGVANQPTYLKDIDVPGDKVVFQDFILSFIVDENLENYMEIQNWMRGLGYPESLAEIYELQKDNNNVDQPPFKSQLNLYSDASLIVLSSSQNSNFKVNFKDMWPYELSSLQFDATDTDIQYLTADVSFKYTIYNITDMNDNRL